MRKILEEAAGIAAVTARALVFNGRSKEACFHPDSSWRVPYFGGYRFEVAPGMRDLDEAVNW